MNLKYQTDSPTKALTIKDVPQNIRNIIETLRMSEISFAEDSLIFENVVAKL